MSKRTAKILFQDMQIESAHDYFGIDNGILWQVVQTDVPKLLEQVERIIQAL